jgi:DNA-binding NtrC family response regulator
MAFESPPHNRVAASASPATSGSAQALPARGFPGDVLIVEDDRDVSSLIEKLLSREGYRCVKVQSAHEALVAVRAMPPGVVLLDLSLPDSQDLELLRKLQVVEPRHRVIIMTAYDNLDIVIGATQAGAFDFITKGPDLTERVKVTVRNAFAAIAQELHVSQLANSLARRDRYSALISHSSAMEPVRAAIDRLSHSRVNVLISGYSGTGKEVVARTIHDSGPRAQGPFVAINCAGIPDTLLESELFGYERGAFTGAQNRKIGKFEAASGGTLFLDEIGEMSLPLQAKLLRVLQDGRFERLGGNTLVSTDSRIIAATNRDLLAMVRAGTFREDLFYRLAVFTLTLPPLIERKGDIPLLVEHFVKLSAREETKPIKGVTPEVMRLFESHPWPGNVRQLQNIIARSALQCDTETIALRDLPASFVQEIMPQGGHNGDTTGQTPRVMETVPAPGNGQAFATQTRAEQENNAQLRQGSIAERLNAALDMAFPSKELLPTVEDLERAGIRLAMRRLDHNMQLTALRLNISRATLYRRLDQADSVSPRRL